MKFGDVNIDDGSIKCFAYVVYKECLKFYADPENMKRFEKWKAERDAAARAKGEPA